MTDVSFHVQLPDKLGYACRLLRKAVNAGSRISVLADPGDLQSLDKLLWTFSQLDFVAHCFADAPALLRDASPVVLGSASRPVIVNLGATVPLGFESFQRLIELVGTDDEEIQNARQRWRIYKAAGLEPTRHEIPAPQPVA